MEGLAMLSSFVIFFILAVPWLVIAATPFAILATAISVPSFLWFFRSPSKLKILIADDDESSVLPLMNTLKKLNIPLDISYVLDGREALRSLRNKTYDFLILDYLMPKLCGDEVLQEAEAIDEIKKTTHVVFYTSNKDEVKYHLQNEYNKFVVDDILDKTLSLSNLNQKLSSLLRIPAA